MTKHEAAIVSAYTGILLGEFREMHKYIEAIMGRPVWTHEMGNKEFAKKIKDKAKSDFITIEIS